MGPQGGDSHTGAPAHQLEPGLVGRDQDVETVSALLLDGARVVTLTGPGGVGKTRLSTQVVAEIENRFDAGAIMVPLETVTTAHGVVPAILGALGVHDLGQRSALDVLTEQLGARRALLVLDNLEQVRDAGTAVAEVLSACPAIRVLATSRVPLRVRGEHEHGLRPLAIPDLAMLPAASVLARVPSVDLFVQRARTARPDFAINDSNAAAIAEICVRLEGLPLAIELAASRVRVLSPAAMLRRLEMRLELGGTGQGPERHQTLRGTIAWSAELLDPAVRIVFQRLGCFVGGFNMSAAESVAAADTGVDVLDAVDALVESSLVRAGTDTEGEARYGMLESIRNFAQEELAESADEAATRQRHATWVQELAEQAMPHFNGPEQAVWITRLDADHDNLRAALNWSAAQGDTVTALRTANAVWRFWKLRGHLAEGRLWLDVLAAQGARMAPGRDRDQLVALALLGAGNLAAYQGDTDGAQSTLRRALELCDALGDEKGMSACLKGLGNAAWFVADWREAAQCFSRCLEIDRNLGDDTAVSIGLNNLGSVHGELGEYEKAGEAFDECIALMRRDGEQREMTAIALCNRADLALRRGDPATASDAAAEALTIARALGARLGVIYALNCLGRSVRMRGQAGRAVLFHTESLELLGEVGERRSLVYTHLYLGDAHLDRGEHRAAAQNLAAAARATSLGDPGAVACCLERSAALLSGVDTRADAAAARLCGAAASLREQRRVRIAPSDLSRHATTADLLRGRLGADRFDAAWREGVDTAPSEALESAASLLTAQIADEAPVAGAPAAHRVLTTVLVTDMVGSTDLAASTDADTWTRLIERHQELTRKELARHGGREVRATGDGVVALFDHPSAGVGCALALVDTLAAAGITIRAGVHTGEYDTGDTAAAGSAVRIADKVAAAGRTGGVMVSSTVRALLAGGPLRLAEVDVAPPEGTSAVYAVIAPDSDDDEVSRRGHSAA